MDGIRFDTLALAVARRGLLGSALALLVTGTRTRGIAALTLPCGERGAGAGCRGNGQCCSNRCRTKKGKRRGKCQCSPLGAPCGETADCCGSRPGDLTTPQCEIKDGSPVLRCCKEIGQSCEDTADCCGGLVCMILSETCELPLP